MEDSIILRGLTKKFYGPSGASYTIREQNGEDDDIISNPSDAKDLTNLANFLAGIVIATDFTTSGVLTVEDAANLPSLDRTCIILNSRIHSIGETLEFSHDWGEDGGVVEYEEVLSQYIFEDYSGIPPKEELASKPEAIPYYPLGKQTTDIEIILSSGKKFLFDLLNGTSESYILNLPYDKKTKNQELMARNLRYEVDGRMDKVTNFKMFSSKEMLELRKKVAEVDPIFMGNIKIYNPNVKDQWGMINLMGTPGFFFPGEI